MCELTSADFPGRTVDLQQHAVSHTTGVASEEGWRKRKREGWGFIWGGGNALACFEENLCSCFNKPFFISFTSISVCRCREKLLSLEGAINPQTVLIQNEWFCVYFYTHTIV